MPVIIQVAIIVATVAVAAIAVALIRTLGQMRATAMQVERTMGRLEHSIPEIERTVIETREVLGTLGSVAGRVDRLSEEFASTGSRLARASSLVVDEIVDPATKIAGLVRAVRTGAGTIVGHYLKRRRAHEVPASEGGNHHE